MDYSIIIPHYNSSATLKQLLDSIPKLNRIEVIVVDDNSNKDEKNEIYKISQQFSNIKLINNDVNRGAGACRNQGLKVSKGKWILFADSDDIFEHNWVEIIDTYLNEELDVIYFNPDSFSDEPLIDSSRHVVFSELVEDYINDNRLKSLVRLKYFYVVPWSKMISNSFVQENKIRFEEISVSNDLLFSAKVGFYAKSITCDCNTIYSVRLSSGSMTTNISRERYFLRLNAWIDYVNFISNNVQLNERKELHLNGMHKLVDVVRYRLGFKSFITTVQILINNNISLIDLRIFNVKFLFSRIMVYKKKWKNEKKVETIK